MTWHDEMLVIYRKYEKCRNAEGQPSLLNMVGLLRKPNLASLRIC